MRNYNRRVQLVYAKKENHTQRTRRNAPARREAHGDQRRHQADIARVHEQVNSIEAELKYGRYEKRLGDLEEKVFGAPRA